VRDLIAPVGVFVVGIALFLSFHQFHVEPQSLEQWTPTLAEKQYEGAKHGRWGERIITLEESACELHRIRYRKVYYIANTCGGLVIEPTSIR
jgi:hypothetical protein